VKRAVYEALMGMLPARLRGRIDYRLGHHAMFFPWGGPMNGQTARLEAVRELIISAQPRLIVETGSYRGTTTEWLAQFGIPVTSVEINPRFHEFSRLRLAQFANVTMVRASSVEFLRDMKPETAVDARPVLFYLDSHWEDYLPLRDELELIFARLPGAIAVIDDFRVPDDPGYGFDDYGPGKALDIDYVMRSGLPGMFTFFPIVEGRQETGARRGCAVLTASAPVAAMLGRINLLREWNDSADNRRNTGP
jgi:hypothetical protein